MLRLRYSAVLSVYLIKIQKGKGKQKILARVPE
jgi:hypothetical protein